MQVFDLRKNRIPNWLIGSMFGGLVYVLLTLISFILPIIPFDAVQDLSLPLLWIIEIEREMVGTLLGINPIVAGIIPYLLLGGLFGAVKSTMSRIIILLFLAGLAPFIVTAFFIYYLVVIHAW